jgi:hypothetical protein
MYIGTCQKFQHRINLHLQDVRPGNRFAHFKVYVAMREHGIDNCTFEIIRSFYCANTVDARIQEQVEINSIPVELRLNMIKAYRSREERLEHNRLNIQQRRLDPAYREHERRYRQLPQNQRKHVEYDKRPEVLERKKLHMRKLREQQKQVN